MLEYVKRGIDNGERDQVEVIILQLNTPGGSIDLMNSIVQEMRASDIPIVVYVAPRGAIAGSAGTVITLAGHASAMAPETAIGAASPVGGQGEDLGETIEAKQKNILKATVRSLAEGRGQEAIQLAEDTIETADAASSSEALDVNLVDFIASDVGDLLDQLDGTTVETAGGERTLDTGGAVVNEFNPTLIEEILGTLTNPNIVFLLLTAAGVASLIIGALVLFNSPGTPQFFRVSVPLVVGTSVATAAIFFTIVTFALRAQFAPIRTGQESLVGKQGIVRSEIQPDHPGTVQLGGELWTAELEDGDQPISQGARVEVVRAQGIRLHVRKSSR
jgi:membrane-bound ClpP family serine protease